MNILAEKLELVKLIIGINNTNVLKRLKTAIKEAEIAETPAYKDDTEYLQSTKSNREQLLESIEQLNRNEGKAIKIKDLWK